MPRTTLAENVAGALRDAILSGEYLSGERLAEMTLAHELHVSPNTVRDALHRLEQWGLVTKVPRYGASVRVYDAAGAAEVYALWSAVETLALGWVLPLDTSGHTALETWLRRAEQQFQTGAVSISAPLFGFHQALAGLTGRAQTRALLENLHHQARILDIVRQTHAPRGHHARADQLRSYQRLLAALSGGDAGAARTILSSYIASEAEVVTALLRA